MNGWVDNTCKKLMACGGFTPETTRFSSVGQQSVSEVKETPFSLFIMIKFVARACRSCSRNLTGRIRDTTFGTEK